MKIIQRHFRLATAIAALMLPALATHAAFFSSDTTIGVGNTNYDGQDIVVYNCTLTVDGTHSFSDVLMVNNAILTHSFSSNGLLPNPMEPGQFVPSGLNLVISNNLVLEDGSAIIADGKGFGSDSGPGAGGSENTDFPFGPPFFYTSGGGGGYGGIGSVSLGGPFMSAFGSAYGQVLAPTNLGSGGGSGSGPGGSGGGSIIITVAGDTLNDGTISANGANGVNGSSGGGSGGGISLTAQSIEGAGSIAANGGAGEAFAGGGGGGGRIAIYAGTNDFTGTISAHGGAGAVVAGGAGTVYTISGNTGNTNFGQVVVDNGGQVGTNSAVDVSQAFDLTISGGALVPLQTAILGVLTINSNSWLLGTSNSQAALNLTLRSNATIQASGGIIADGDGSGSLTGGQGAGGHGSMNGISTGGGGGYGGYGGPGAGSFPETGGTAFGSVMQPTAPGGGGGMGAGNTPFSAGGTGGGAIILNISGALTLNGLISANGHAGIGEASGGGAGGGVMLTAGKLLGSGLISANGGSGQLPLGGGGGGGRIAVYATSNLFAGTITAFGGPGFVGGGAGTIYKMLPPNGLQAALIVADNGGLRGTNTLLSSITGTLDIVVTNGAVLVPSGTFPLMRNLFVGANSFLTVTQSLATMQFTVQSNLTIQPGGGIILDGLGTPGGVSSTGSGGTGNTNGLLTGGGGGYGGFGGSSAGGGFGGNSYGQITEPSTYGSSGANGTGNAPLNFGGSGGGFVFLTVNGTLQVDGIISANGTPGLGQGSGGGSGGGIRLSAGKLAGSGIISANGGAGSSGLGGGGGGGRVFVSANTNVYTGVYAAHGGPGFVAGGAGTIYLVMNFSQTAQLILDNGGLLGTNTPIVTTIENADLIITNGAMLAVNSTTLLSSIRNLVIGSNSFFTLTSTVPSSVTISTINLTILSGGVMSLDGMGSTGGTTGQGVGSSFTTNNILMGGGGGHGGIGGSSASGVPGGVSFDSIIQPINVGGPGGSGGGFSPSNFGGGGGGAVHLSASGVMQISGRLSANGTAGVGQSSGGGAGGSIWLSAGTLTGNGSISANGGAGEPSLGGGGGGAGGRIALYPNTNSFAGSVTAYGGAGFMPGGAGTVYYQTNSAKTTLLVVDNGGQIGATTPLGSAVQSTYDLVITNGANLSVLSFVSVHGLVIGSNSLLTVPTEEMVLTITSNVFVAATGAIIGDGGNTSSGQGFGSSSSIGNVVSGGGGGFGGYGGASGRGVPGGTSYGSYTEPASFGSVGGAGNGSTPNNRGGYGGAEIQLTLGGTLTVNGVISANGTTGVGEASGGGSGGSVQINATTLLGNGTISANGGAGEPSLGGGGGGGGGRVALLLGTNQFAGIVSAHGGQGAVAGGAGTIYTGPSRYPVTTIAQIVFDNGGLRGTNTPFMPNGITSDMMIFNGASVAMSSGSTLRNLTVGSNSVLTGGTFTSAGLFLTLTGTASIQAGGVISLDGEGTSGSQSGQGSGGSISTNNSFTGGGGGYGGNGGMGATGSPGGGTYGSITQPNQTGGNGGRGNGTSPASNGGAGGGVLELNITGGLQLNGAITANGLMGIGEGSGGGAGGTVFVTVSGAFSGNGLVAVNGGAGESALGGGGGGGRIAITFGTNQFTGKLTAFGGQGFANGGPGTIYTKLLFGNNSQFGSVVLDGGGIPGNSTFTALPNFSINSDLTITGGAKVNAAGSGRLSAHNLLVASNSVLSFAGTNGFNAAGMNVTGNATVQAGGQIIADGGGFWGNSGTGAGSFALSSGGQNISMATGGGYGGYGGGSQIALAPGASYGSINRPISMGSGGGCSGQQPLSISAGGGSVQMTITGTLDVEGSISANGNSPGADGCGGGSGGSIQLTAQTLTGAGSISANGGSGLMPYNGGGGGGRIAIYGTSNHFTCTLAARGGQGFVGGGAGTVYTRFNNQGSIASVTVDNGGLHGTNTLLSSPEAFNLTVSGNGIAMTPPAATPPTDPTLFFNSLLVQSNGVVTTPSANYDASIVIFGNATIATNGTISADGQGYDGGTFGPGPGAGGDESGSGAGYGGAGGASASGTPGGSTYGSIQQPTDLGSQGGLPFAGLLNFSQGGGSIHMEVGGTLTVNGAITANGKSAIIPGAGGGSGGSVWLEASSLNGNGAITANGGAGEPSSGGGGGGGRIALDTLANNFTGVTTASGAMGAFPGQNGTIFKTNLPTAQITSQAPTGPVTNAVSSITLTTSSQFAQVPFPFTASSFSINTPNGIISPDSISVLTGNSYPQDISLITLTFAPQIAMGTYTVQVNPGEEDIYGLALSTNFVGSFDLTQPIVSGVITDTNNNPISGATVQADGGVSSAITDGNGNYLLSLPTGYTGAITPSDGGYLFIPSSASYTNLVAATNQNFTAVPPTIFALNAVPQGNNVNLAWYGASGVKYQVLCSTNFVDWKPCGDVITGSNAACNYTVPVGNAPQMFFRFGAAY